MRGFSRGPGMAPCCSDQGRMSVRTASRAPGGAVAIAGIDAPTVVACSRAFAPTTARGRSRRLRPATICRSRSRASMPSSSSSISAEPRCEGAWPTSRAEPPGEDDRAGQHGRRRPRRPGAEGRRRRFCPRDIVTDLLRRAVQLVGRARSGSAARHGASHRGARAAHGLDARRHRRRGAHAARARAGRASWRRSQQQGHARRLSIWSAPSDATDQHLLASSVSPRARAGRPIAAPPRLGRGRIDPGPIVRVGRLVA